LLAALQIISTHLCAKSAKTMGLFSRWAIHLLFASATLVYLMGLGIDVMEIDAAQYASMSREMAETNNYLQVEHRGRDYLDKPPLLFWVSSLFIKIFGNASWAYKFASFLFSILGVVSTYKLGHLLYNKRIGFVAAIMLGSSQAYFLFNNDVRTDTILTATVIFAVWQIMAFVFYRNNWHLIGGFVGIGLGMLAKGPIALMVPVLALGSYFIGRKRYREFLRIEWLWGFVIIAIMLAPMLWGLYTQFDSQPTKQVAMVAPNGTQMQTDVSGVRFYLWTQSFGRITGENLWSDNTPPTFFIDNFLWSFLPWSILAIWALFWRLGNTIVDVVKDRKKQEWLTLGGFLLPFIAFSASSYKLPHYIFVLYPFAAIFTAEFVLRTIFEKPQWWNRIMVSTQILVVITLFAVSSFLLYLPFGVAPWWVWLVFIGLTALAVFNFFEEERINRVVLSSAFITVAANWALNSHFYPELMKYQPGKPAANYVNEAKLPKQNIFISGGYGYYSFGFYGNHIFYDAYNPYFDSVLTNHAPIWIFTDENEWHKIQKNYQAAEIEQTFHAYPVSKLTPKFLNPKTRDQVLKKQYLIKIPEL